ncbi:MAG: N-acetylmuramoyl-L-alanine amidase [Victivallales bacterium]|nr:N-acetylmuramoyl-L-alanine amidase [Victivallales bacterium]
MKKGLLTVFVVGLAFCCGCVHHQQPMARPDMPNKSVGYYKGLKIRADHLEATDYNKRYKLPGPMPELKYITIHNTANVATAQNERDYLNRRSDKVSISFHYAVDEKEAIQIMSHDQHAWHAGDGRGDGNMKSIGVEICRSLCKGDKFDLYLKSEANAVKLAAWLLKVNNLTIDDLRMHYDWTRKWCPHRMLDANRWTEFRERVRRMMEDEDWDEYLKAVEQ